MTKRSKVKEAPNSKESEMMVLGCMLTSVNSLSVAAKFLDKLDFYYLDHQAIFHVLKNSYNQNKPADVHLVCEEMKRQDKLDAIGGAAYITAIAQYAGTSAYIEEYCEIVKSKATLRRMIQAAQIVEKSALEDPPDAHQALDDAQGLFANIAKHQCSNLQIQFINERCTHFLLDDALEMPRLINFVGKDNISRPFIRKGITGMLVGAGGVGKTHLLVQLGLSIVTGSPFLKKYPIEKPGAVFIGLGENADEDIHRLLRKTFKNLFLVSPQLTFDEEQALETISRRLAVKSFTGMPSSFIEQGRPTRVFNALLEELKSREPADGWSCIILDPISRFLGADAETDNAAATAFIELLERLTLELNGRPTVLFGHHMNKSGVSGTNTDQAAARGSSALTDGVRLQINLEKVLKDDSKNKNEDDSKYEKNKVRMRIVKSNFTSILEPQILEKDYTGCLSTVSENGKLSHETEEGEDFIRSKNIKMKRSPK